MSECFKPGVFKSDSVLNRKGDADAYSREWQSSSVGSVLPAESSTAHLSGDFVVFIIGVAVHNWLDVKAWWPVVTGFGRMMKELQVCSEYLLLIRPTHA